jgi:hypothetical protein
MPYVSTAPEQMSDDAALEERPVQSRRKKGVWSGGRKISREAMRFLPLNLAKTVASNLRQEVTLLSKLYLHTSLLAMWFRKEVLMNMDIQSRHER